MNCLFRICYGFILLENTNKSTICIRNNCCFKFGSKEKIIKEYIISQKLRRHKDSEYFVEQDYIRVGSHHGLLSILYESDLYNFVKNNKVTDIELIQFGFQIIKIIVSLHNLGLCYLDVKPENFVMRTGVSLMLIDFETISKHDEPVINSSSTVSIPITDRIFNAKYQYDIYGILNTFEYLGILRTKNNSWNTIVSFLQTADKDDWENNKNHATLETLLNNLILF